MSEQSSKRTARERMEREREQQNAEVRDRVYCLQCNRSVRSEDYGWKYAQAGGVLAGPFCSAECQLEWLL